MTPSALLSGPVHCIFVGAQLVVLHLGVRALTSWNLACRAQQEHLVCNLIAALDLSL